MKKYILIIITLCFIWSCDEERGQYGLDSTVPQQIENPIVENIPGGAIISYEIPEDDDLLYVKVLYTLDDGTQMEQKSSAYTTSIKVEGLGRSKKQMVSLITGDRSKNESDPVLVEIYPEDAPIYDILETVKISNDFGGIHLEWENPLKANVVLTVHALNEKENKFTDAENFYSNAGAGKGNVRGFPSVETLFGVSLRDRWGNHTDTISGKFFPYFEEELNKSKFARWNPPGIPYAAHSTWSIERMWDGVRGSSATIGFMLPATTVLPANFTMNMGQLAKLSRIKLYQRTNLDQTYTAGNVKRFKLYGSNHSGVSSDYSTWVYMGEFESYKPSGLPVGQVSEEDIAFANAGEDYNMDINLPAVQYLRFEIEKTWGGAVNAVFMEIDIFGDIQE